MIQCILVLIISIILAYRMWIEMKKKLFLKIKISLVDNYDLINLFNTKKNDDQLSGDFTVVNPRLFRTANGYRPLFDGFKVYDSDHQLLGGIGIKEFSTCVVVSFYLEEDIHEQAFSRFIEIIKGEMVFIGVEIMDTQGFGDTTINEENKVGPYLPKTENARKNWGRLYAIIQSMRDEAENSDEWEYSVPNYADYRDRIKQVLNVEYSERTISRIIKAGDAGLLNE